MKQNDYSDSFKVFLGLCFFLLLGNLFLTNQYATVWNGTETSLLRTAQEGTANNPVAFLMEMIYKASHQRTTIFVTTHYMDEAEYCDRVSIMVNGKIEALDTPKKLKEQFKVENMNDVFLKLARGWNDLLVL